MCNAIWSRVAGVSLGLAILLAVSALFNFGFNSMNSTETLFLIQKFAAQPWQIGLLTMSAGIAIAVVQAVLVLLEQ